MAEENINMYAVLCYAKYPNQTPKMLCRASLANRLHHASSSGHPYFNHIKSLSARIKLCPSPQIRSSVANRRHPIWILGNNSSHFLASNAWNPLLVACSVLRIVAHNLAASLFSTEILREQ